jgi:hypothetical protein
VFLDLVAVVALAVLLVVDMVEVLVRTEDPLLLLTLNLSHKHTQNLHSLLKGCILSWCILRNADVIFSAPAPRPGGGKGMQLGRKQKTEALVEAIKTEEGIVDDSSDRAIGGAGTPPHATPVHHERSRRIYCIMSPCLYLLCLFSVHIAVEEKISVNVSRDGGLENMEVKGTMQLRVTDPAKAQLRVALKPSNNSHVQFIVCSCL